MMDAEDLCLYHKPLTGGRECLLIKSGYLTISPQMKDLIHPKALSGLAAALAAGRAAGPGFSL